MRDLLAGHIDMTIDLLGNAVPQVKEGKLKMLAGRRRKSQPCASRRPPPCSETVPGYALEDWFSIVAPPKTPSEIAAKLAAAIGEALKAPDVAKRLDDLFVIAVGSTPAETAVMIAQERERWRQDIGALGLPGGDDADDSASRRQSKAMAHPRNVEAGGSLGPLLPQPVRIIGWDVVVFERARGDLAGRGALVSARPRRACLR